MAASPRPRRTARFAKAVPPPIPPMRLLKLRAPTMPPGFVKGRCRLPPSHVLRPSTASLYAQSGRMPLPLQAPRRPKRGSGVPHATPPAARPICAPPGPRSFSERASPRPLRQGRVAKAASPWPRRRRATAHSAAHSAAALAEASRSDHATGVCQRKMPPAHVPRPSSLYAQSGRMPLPLQAPRRPKRGSGVPHATPPAARPICASPGPRSFSERASPRQRRRGRVDMAASPRPRRTARFAKAVPPPIPPMRLLKLRAPTMPPGFVKGRCRLPPSHVLRPSTASLYAQSGRMPLPLQAPRRPKRGSGVPHATPPAAIPIPAPPGPRSFSERASPRQRRQGARRHGRFAKAASPRPRRRPSAAHSAAALAEASRSDHAAGVVKGRCRPPTSHVLRPGPFTHKAAGCRFHFRLHADQSGGAGSRTLLHPPPARFPRRAGVVKGRCRLPPSHVLRPGPFTHKAAGCRFHFRLHADQSGGRGPVRYSTCRHPDSRAAPGLSKEDRACPRPTSFAPVPLRTKRQDAASTLGSTPLTKARERGPARYSTCRRPVPAPPARFPRRPPDPRATRTAKLQRARVAKVFVAKAASHRPSTAALAEASRSDHAAGVVKGT
jgi:hypothetical protein